MLKKGVNSTTETRKWASATLIWSLNPWISYAWSILSKGTPPPLRPSLIFMASLPRYQKTYLLCTISLEYSATEKNPKFPSILKSHWKSSLRLFLHRALQLFYPHCNYKPSLHFGMRIFGSQKQSHLALYGGNSIPNPRIMSRLQNNSPMATVTLLESGTKVVGET